MILTCTSCDKEFNLTDKTKRTRLSKGYSITICSICINRENNKKRISNLSDKEKQAIIKKREKTSLERYGVTNKFKLKETRDKIKATNLERYGVEHNWSSEEVREKIKQTNLERYGVENTFQLESIKQTNLERYGVECPLQSEEIQDKIKATNLERYGSEQILASKEIQDKIKATNLERYGSEYIGGSKIIKERISQTNIEKYGSDYPLSNPEIRLKTIKSSRFPRQEKKLIELLTNRGIEFEHQYLSDVNGHSHVFDFAIFKDGNLTALVDCDGIYYHGYKSDSNGKHVRDEYDISRTLSIPPNIKFIIILENMFEQGVADMFKALSMDYDSYISNIFNWCRTLEFPYPKYSNDLIKRSILSLTKYNEFKPKSHIGIKAIRHYHPSIYHCNIENHISPYNAWFDDELLKKVIKNRFIYVNKLDSSRILEGFNISKIAPKVSVFKPTLAKTLIQKYLNKYKTIFDPFSGFSGRLLGTIASNKLYIGQDINPVTVNESNILIKDLNITTASIIEKDIIKDFGEYDCLFTCPPYNLKESWNQEIENKSCDEWIDICLANYKCKKYLFVVNDTEKYKEYIIESIDNKSHFSNSKEYIILI